MTLEDQYEKETGRYAESYVPGESYTDSYVEWLEEKLTWKKFSEKTPKAGSDIIYKRITHCFCFGISEEMINHLAKSHLEIEWVYVQQ